jgi:MOSC domain-containing protein YiiM
MKADRAPSVVGLFIASAAGEPMESREAVEVVPGVGIPGDRYATGRGHWSDPRWPDQQVTLVEAELAEALGLPLDGLRRNIVTRNAGLETLIGQTFTIGTATLQGVRPCDPCRYIETLTRQGLFEELAGRGGLRAAVIEAGVIQVGDTVTQR